MDINAIDKNFETGVPTAEGVRFYDVKGAPFSVFGLYDYSSEGPFRRMPRECAEKISVGVSNLSLHTAGGRVRFSTNSEYIIIEADVNPVSRMPHMAFTGSCGFDLYIDGMGVRGYLGTFVPPMPPGGKYRSRLETHSGGKMQSYTINFPLYSGVISLFIGVDENSEIDIGEKYINEKPVVFYGSSITQGGCASRPGNSYQNIICQRYNLDYINLGFSGSARGEGEIVEYLSSLNMSAFVSDYDHNAPTAEHLRKTHFKLYEAVRKKHPEIPYIMLSKVDFDKEPESCAERREVIKETYTRALALGDKNVYFIDGETVFDGPYRGMCTVDGIHPNDLGFALVADKIGKKLAYVLGLDKK